MTAPANNNSEPNSTDCMPGERRSPQRSRRVATSSGLLLNRVLPVLGVDRIAAALGVPIGELQAMAAGDQGMTLPQQSRLADYVVRTCTESRDLMRRATALRGQVRAAEAYASGATERHNSGPMRLHW